MTTSTEVTIPEPKMLMANAKYRTPDLLADAIADYFNKTDIDNVTQSGLCIHLNLSKKAFYNYQDRPGYEDLIEMARLMVENSYEVALREQGGAGNIFALKQFGWVDKQERVISGNPEAPLVTKIVREIINVQQINLQAEYSQLSDCSSDDFDYEL